MDDIYYPVAHRTQDEIDSFKQRYETFDTSIIPEIFRKSLGVKVADFRRSSSYGSSHVVYYVDINGKDKPLVLRANTGFKKEPECVMKVEQLITDKVSALGIPTNKVVYVDISRKTFPFDFQIEECLEGNDLEDHFSGTQKEYDNLSYEIGVLIAKMHTITFEKFGRFDEKQAVAGHLLGTKDHFYEYVVTNLNSDLTYLVNASVISQATSEVISSLFKEREGMINQTSGSLIHHDLADHNIMFQGKRITGIFDWETAVSGDPMLDIASCPTWKTHYPRAEKLLEGYTSIATLPTDYEERINIYRLRTMIWKMVYAIRANILDDARKNRFYIALEPFNLKTHA